MLTDDQLCELLRGTGVIPAKRTSLRLSSKDRVWVALGMILLPPLSLILFIKTLTVWL